MINFLYEFIEKVWLTYNFVFCAFCLVAIAISVSYFALKLHDVAMFINFVLEIFDKIQIYSALPVKRNLYMAPLPDASMYAREVDCSAISADYRYLRYLPLLYLSFASLTANVKENTRPVHFVSSFKVITK